MANNQQVAHSFAYGQSDKGSNFYSESYGNLLYSYSSLLARRFNNGLILISERIANYSSTSQRHDLHLRRAINHMDYIYVSELDSYSKLEDILNDKELEFKCKELEEILLKQKRARVTDYSYAIQRLTREMDMIVEHGNIDKRKQPYKTYKALTGEGDIDSLLAQAEDRAKKQREKQARDRMKANVKRFEAFTGVKNMYTAVELRDYNYLRIDNDILTTNGSVRVPLADARILYKAFKSGKSVVGKKIGYYTILKANNKEVKIGCHNILVKELDRVLGE